MRKGVLSTYVQIFIAVPIAFLYIVSLCAAKVEKIYIITWLFKYNVICIGIMVVIYLLDGFLFVYD